MLSVLSVVSSLGAEEDEGGFPGNTGERGQVANGPPDGKTGHMGDMGPEDEIEEEVEDTEDVLRLFDPGTRQIHIYIFYFNKAKHLYAEET